MSPLAIRIKELRDVKGWSQAELARQSGVPQPTISRLEARQSDSVSLSNLERLAKALGCEPGYLIVKMRR